MSRENPARSIFPPKQHRILIIGSGGREHAMARAFARSQRQVELHVIGPTRNPGLAKLANSYHVMPITDARRIVQKACELKITMAIIGPEAALEAGVTDSLSKYIPCVGPHSALARIETSKTYARDLLEKAGYADTGFLPESRRFTVCSDFSYFSDLLEPFSNNYVIKPDGLTGGKGVKLSGSDLKDLNEAFEYAKEVLNAGHSAVIVEEKLVGQEFSLMSFCDGQHVVHMPVVVDYKRELENDRGLNTGGMGCILLKDHSFPFLDEDDVEMARQINESALMLLMEDNGGAPYRGIIYGGYMKVDQAPHDAAPSIRLLEFNARFGDPEGIAVLEVLQTDFVDLCEQLVSGNLVSVEFREQHCLVQYVCPEGYPEKPLKGESIDFLDIEGRDKDRLIFAGVELDGDSEDSDEVFYKMTGSRAIAVVASGTNYNQTLNQVADLIDQINGRVYYRPDIGEKYLEFFVNEEQDEDSNAYQKAGVNLNEAERAMKKIVPLVKETGEERPGRYVPNVGGFAGLYRVPGSKDQLMVSTIDGVGTKSKFVIEVLGQCSGLEKLGADLVYANLNDLLVVGLDVEPLFFLDYYGCGKLRSRQLETFVSGVSRACISEGIVLSGGETAELNTLSSNCRELVGCLVGSVSESKLLKKEHVKEGDVVIGIASSGPHTNGYSLLNRLREKGLLDVDRYVDSLTAVHRNYSPYIENIVVNEGIVPHGLCHITGGGLVENPPRVMSDELGIAWEEWEMPEVFRHIQEVGELSDREMRRVFNCGVGFLVIVREEDEEVVLRLFDKTNVFRVGRVLSKRELEVKVKGVAKCFG